MPPPDVGFLDEVGLLGVVVYLLVREATAWFRKKDEHEDRLITTLVEDMRATQHALMDKLFELHRQQHEDLRAVRAELTAIRERLDRVMDGR